MPHDRLYEEALSMSVNKNLLDVTTLLEFAHSTESILEKARHTLRRPLSPSLGGSYLA